MDAHTPAGRKFGERLQRNHSRLACRCLLCLELALCCFRSPFTRYTPCRDWLKECSLIDGTRPLIGQPAPPRTSQTHPRRKLPFKKIWIAQTALFPFLPLLLQATPPRPTNRYSKLPHGENSRFACFFQFSIELWEKVPGHSFISRTNCGNAPP